MSEPSPDHIRALVAAACDDRLTDTEARELSAWLITSAAVREAYFHHTQLEAMLHRLPAAEGDGAGLSMGVDPARAHFRGRAAVAIAAAVMLVAAVTFALLHGRRQAPPDDSPAVLVAAINASWEMPLRELHDGDHLPNSVLKLHTGLIRIGLPSGTTVIVEGPAEFRLASNARIELRRGAMAAHVSPAGKGGDGFTIATAQASVTDLGTQFGVYVDDHATAHAEVFQGKVRVTPRDAAHPSRILQRDQAVDVESDGSIHESRPQPVAFVTPDQFTAIASTANRRLGRWSSLRDELSRDPSLVAYYTFDGQNPSSKILRNNAAATAGHFNGTIDQAVWTEGRFAGKSALAFDGKDAAVHIDIPGALPTFTLAAWVNVESFDEPAWRKRPDGMRDHQFSALMLSDGKRLSAVHWQVMDGQLLEIGLGLTSDNPVAFGRYRSGEALEPEDRNHWVFLAVVFDAAAGEVRHYLNGEPVGTAELGAHPDPVIGKAELGNWSSEGVNEFPFRGLKGKIDEFVIERRVMTDQEIEAMYLAGGGE